MSSKDFNIYAIGGTGINIVNRYLKDARHGGFVETIVGIDSSTANPIAEGLFPLERLEGAEGSGGFRGAHKEKYGDFAKQILAKYSPNKVNIVVFSCGGGTGSGLGPFLVRYMLQRKIPVLSIVIGDTSTFNEQKNTIEALGSLYNQTSLGNSVLFSYLENKPEVSQGEVNAQAAARIDNTIMMFNLSNERIDYADVKNFFFYNDIVDADPILTQLTFLPENDLTKYGRRPVAAISLYPNGDDIRVPYENMLYRKAGVFGPSFHGLTGSVHAVLDHGDTLKGIEEMVEKKNVKADELAGAFRNKHKNPFGAAGDSDGML